MGVVDRGSKLFPQSYLAARSLSTYRLRTNEKDFGRGSEVLTEGYVSHVWNYWKIIYISDMSVIKGNL